MLKQLLKWDTFIIKRRLVLVYQACLSLVEFFYFVIVKLRAKLHDNFHTYSQINRCYSFSSIWLSFRLVT